MTTPRFAAHEEKDYANPIINLTSNLTLIPIGNATEGGITIHDQPEINFFDLLPAFCQFFF